MKPTLIAAYALMALACSDETPGKAITIDPGGAEQVMPDPMMPGSEAPPSVPEVPDPRPADPAVLTITTPARGARGFGERIRVEGTVTGGAAPRLEVGGQVVELLAGGRFAADLSARPGTNIVVTRVIDATGDLEDRRAVLQDADADPRAAVANGVGAHVSDDGLDAVAALISDYLADLDLESLVDGNVPEGITIDSVEYDRIEVRLRPEDDLLVATLRVHGLHVALQGEVSFGVAFTVRGTADADPAEVVAEITIAADGRGGLDLDVRSAQVRLQNFDYDVNNVPEFVEGWFEGRVREFAQNLVAEAITDFVVPSLFDPSALSRTIEVLGTELELGLTIAEVETTPQGVTLGMDGRATASQTAHAGDAAGLLGGTPEYDKGAHLDVAIAADFVARILHAAWAGGALDVELGPGADIELPVPLSTAVIAPALGAAGASVDRAAPLLIRMRPLLPPTVRIEPGERPLVIEMGDLLFDLYTASDGVLVTMAVDLVSRTTLDVSGLDAIELGADVTAEVNADVAETPRGPVDDARLEQLIEGLAGAIPGLLASQTFAFGTDVLPVPLRFDQPRFEADSRAPHVHVRTGIAAP